MNFTPRNVTKYVAKTAVKFYVAGAVSTLIDDHTQFDDDSFVNQSVSYAIGWGVSDKLKPVTDKIVDVTADKLVALRNRKNQEDTPEEK